MPVFVSTTFYKDNSSVIKAIELLIKYNIRNIELGSIHKYESSFDKKINKYNCNFITHNFFPPNKDNIILNLSSLDDEIRQQSIEFMKEAIDFAVELNLLLYTFHPGFICNPISKSNSKQNYDWEFESINNKIPYDEYYSRFYDSLIALIRHVDNKPIKLAIETQGSYYKNNNMLFTNPNEYIELIDRVNDERIGYNLNLAHMKLASEANNFDISEIIKRLEEYIFAIELSHNFNLDDSHRELYSDGWYWDIFDRFNFKGIPIIFEGRNVSIHDVVNSYILLQEHING